MHTDLIEILIEKGSEKGISVVMHSLGEQIRLQHFFVFKKAGNRANIFKHWSSGHLPYIMREIEYIDFREAPRIEALCISRQPIYDALDNYNPAEIKAITSIFTELSNEWVGFIPIYTNGTWWGMGFFSKYTPFTADETGSLERIMSIYGSVLRKELLECQAKQRQEEDFWANLFSLLDL